MVVAISSCSWGLRESWCGSREMNVRGSSQVSATRGGSQVDWLASRHVCHGEIPSNENPKVKGKKRSLIFSS